MAKPSKTLRMALDQAARLPKYPNEQAAKKGYFAVMAVRRDRLRRILESAQGPPFSVSAEGLRSLEIWAGSLTPEACNRLRCSTEELDLLLHWHMASVAVQCVPHTRWAVERSPFARGRWQIGVRCGLMTVCMSLEPDPPATSKRRRVSTTPFSDQLRWFEDRASGDPTLHPAVLACESKLSKENGLRTCQTFTLIRGIDAFSEPALVAALPNSKGVKQLEVIRCFESLRSLSDAAVRALCEAARAKDGWADHAIGLVIQHRPGTGLKLAKELGHKLREYTYGPVVGAIVSIQDLTATDILADAVCKISARQHPLWQARETYAQALSRLWRSARDGDVQAQAALVMAGRRWKRIPPETLALIRRHAPGLTMELARAGGVAKRSRK